MQRLFTSILAIALGVPLSAQELQYERYLVPIAVRNAPGAYGSLWTTDVYGVHDIDAVFVDAGFNFLGQPVGFGPEWEYVPPIFPTGPGEPPGSILYVREPWVPHIHLTSRVREVSYADAEPGFGIPVVSEHEFTADAHYFLGLRVDPGLRSMLRIYSLDLDTSDPRVRVQVRTKNARGEDIVIAEQFVTLHAVQRTISRGPETFEIRPLAAEISIEALLEDLPVQPSRIRITVQPVTEGLRTWSFVSSAFNNDQHIAVFLPN